MNDAATLTSDEIAVARALEGVLSWLRQARQPEGLSVSAVSVLSRLQANGPMRITDLSEREGLSQPGITTLVNRLVSGGLATRGADTSDGRVVLVSITSAGLLRLQQYRDARAELVAERLRSLSPSDRDALSAALPALAHIVRSTTTPEEEKA